MPADQQPHPPQGPGGPGRGPQRPPDDFGPGAPWPSSPPPPGPPVPGPPVPGLAVTGGFGPPGWPPVVAAPRNGMGTAALVLGIIGAVLSCTFYLSPVALLLALLALVFGGVGLSRAERGLATNRAAALSGLWTGGGAALVAAVLSVIFFVWVSQPVEVTSDAGSAYLAEAGATVTYEDGLSVVIAAPRESVSGSSVTLTAELTNDGEDGVGLDSGTMVALADGERLAAGRVRHTTSEPGSVRPGETQALTYTVDVPAGTRELGLDFTPTADHATCYWVFTLVPSEVETGVTA